MRTIAAILLMLPTIALAQTHTMPGSNVVPSGASLTIQSGGSITAAAGSTVTGFGTGGGGNVSNSGTPTAGQKATWVDATHIQGVADNALQWDGGATNLVAATARTSLGLVIGTNVQAFDTDLTTWAGITPAANVGTFLATPSSANLRLTMTDENGTGALLFNGATTPDFTTGFTIGAAAASGKILIGNGTNFVPSTPAYPNAASPTALKWLRADGTNWIASTSTLAEGGVTAGKMLQSDATNWVASAATWPTTNTAGYYVMGNGTNYVAYPADLENTSTATVSGGYAADTYLAGSTITIAAGDWKVNGAYHCRFDMTKTGAGVATPIITVRMGTLGTTSDATIATLTFLAGTAVIDSGIFDVDVVFRSVGSGTSAVIAVLSSCQHSLAATGLTSSGAAGGGFAGVISAGFNSTTQTKIGLSFNGGSAFSGTNSIVITSLHQP